MTPEETQGFSVFNNMDGFFASPDIFATREEAEKFVEDFPKRFEHQGYYSSNSGRIPLDELDLQIISV